MDIESEGYKMKKTRRHWKYRVYMWFYRLTKDDFYKVLRCIVDTIGLALTVILIFIVIFILPAFFM